LAHTQKKENQQTERVSILDYFLMTACKRKRTKIDLTVW